EAKAALAAGGPRVACVNHPFAANLATDDGAATQGLLKTIDIAVTLDANLIYLVSGGRGSMVWGQGAGRLAELIAPCIPVAREKGVRLTVETASEFNVDIHMAHTLDDTIRLAEI